MKANIQLLVKYAAVIISIVTALHDSLKFLYSMEGLLAGIVLTLYIIHKNVNSEKFKQCSHRKTLDALYWSGILLLMINQYFIKLEAVTRISEGIFMIIIVILCEMLMDSLLDD